MRSVALAVCALAVASARADEERYQCAGVLAQLRTELRDAQLIPLDDPPLVAFDEERAGARCDAFEPVARALRGGGSRRLERGTIGGHRAALSSDGPHGSGHFWDLTLAIDLEGKTVGACPMTATSGWRNLPADGTRLFGQWRALADDRLLLWTTLAIGASEWESLIVPLVYGLSDRALVVDRAATLAAIGRFAHAYARVAALPDDRARAMHRVGAAAYGALADSKACP
jgi:hypothetical protein